MKLVALTLAVMLAIASWGMFQFYGTVVPSTARTETLNVSTEPTRPTFRWPPRLNRPYPDLQLIDQDGQLTRLSDFRGRVILVEPIGMPCKACQAFCGGHEAGGFDGIPPQPGLPSMEQAARLYGGFDLSDERLIKVYLILYNLDMKAPSAAEVRAWADHFLLQRDRHEIVLAGLPSMIGQASYEMIPGVQLIDRDFVLRFDSTGRRNQRHDLYRELLPAARRMLMVP